MHGLIDWGMNILDYYRHLLWRAFSHAFGFADAIAGLIGMALPPAIKFMPFANGQERVMNDLTWQVPLGILVSLFTVRLLLSPYWIHKEKERELSNAKRMVNARQGTIDDPIVPDTIVRIIITQETEIGTSQSPGFPRSSRNVQWLRVHAFIDYTDYITPEAMVLIIPGYSPIPVNQGNEQLDRGFLRSGYYYFEIPTSVNPGIYYAQIRVRADGKWWGSHEFRAEISGP